MIRLVVLLLLSYAVQSNAFTPVQGQFEATKSCPAYISKNKKSNPDNLESTPQQSYQLIEVNRNKNPDWLRIVFPDNANPLRWINASCGTALYEIHDTSSCNQNAGHADSYVLALSWQPAFCQTYGYEAGKPECLKLKPGSYQASHLVLHGLWPNQDNCGQNYGFCEAEPQKSHCDYPALNLDTDTAKKLQVVMPSYAYGSCLERHEWYKHGTCQILSQSAYFDLASRLTKEADQMPLGIYLHEHLGERVARKQLEDQVRASFGKDATRKVYLGCKNGLLVDIFVQLPPLIPATESLESLVKKAPDLKRYEGCPTTVGISDFNSESSLEYEPATMFALAH